MLLAMITGSNDLVLLGGGGHALVVAEAAMASGWNLVGFFDDAEGGVMTTKFRLMRRGSLGSVRTFLDENQRVHWIIAMGDLNLRSRVMDQFRDYQHRVAKVIHPHAVIGANAHVGIGTFVAARAVVQTFARVDTHCIVNTGAIVEHECEISENVHVGPGAVIAGNVRVLRGAFVGMGSRVLPGLRIGAGSIVGAGAVVTEDVGDYLTVAGVPARIINKR